MMKKIYLVMLSLLSTCGLLAQGPSAGVFRIVSEEYNAAITEDFVNGTLSCTAVGGDEAYEQMWKLIPNGNNYYLQKVFTGRYVQTGNSGTEVPYWTGKSAKEFSIVKSSNWPGYNIWDTGLGAGQGLHSKGATGNVVRWWSETSKAASEWNFVSVDITDEQIAAAQAVFREFAGVQENADAYEAALKNVFEDAACTVLKAQYAAMDDEVLRDALTAMNLPETLVEMAVKVKNDAWGEANEKAGKPAWDGDYAKKFRVQLVEPHSIAGEITSWFGYNAHSNMDNPVGIYVNKLQVAYIMVEGEIADGSELWVTYINGHSKMPNYNNGYPNGMRLKSGLNVVPFGVDGSALYFNYLVHTYNSATGTFPHKLSDYDDLKIHVEGGYINGYYNAHGDALYKADTDADWVYYEDRANMRNITILGRHQVLQFELNDVTITEDNGNKWTEKGLAKLFPDMLPTSLPANQRINTIVEAWDRIMLSELMTLGVVSKEVVDSMNLLYPRWDGKWENKAEMYNYEGYYDYCDGRNYGEYYNHRGLAFGTVTGYMYGSWDHCGYHINTTPSILTSIATEAGSTWGPGHEIGHQHQGLFTVNGLTEVTNNLFSNIAVWYMGMGTSRINGTEGNLAHVYDNYKAGNDFFGNNIWALTHMYYRLWLYYHRAGNDTQFYPKLFELLRNNPIQKTGYYQAGKTSILHFYQLCCEAAQEDLTEFFRAHGFFCVMKNRFVGDYSNSEYTQSQADIDAAIAAVKAKGYPVNNKPLFINDCTPDATYRHDGKTQRSYWDGDQTTNGTNAEVGSYISYVSGDTITGRYVYSLSDTRLTISSGQNAVGFAIYDKEGKIVAFSSHHTFVITDEVAAMIRADEVTIVAVAGTGADMKVVSKAQGGTEAEQLQALKNALAEANDILSLSDDTGTNVGYFKSNYLGALTALVRDAEQARDNKDTSVHSYGEWAIVLEQAVMAICAKSEAKVPLYTDDYYALNSVRHKNTSLEYSTAGLKVTFSVAAENTKKQWIFVPAEEPNQYYIKNLESGMYVSLVNSGARVKAAATDVKDAIAFNLIEDEPAVFLLQSVSNTSLYLACDNSKNVFAADGVSSVAHWAISSLVDNHSAIMKTKLETLLGMVDITLNELIASSEPELKLHDDITILDEQLIDYIVTLRTAYAAARKAIEDGYAYLDEMYADVDEAHNQVKAAYQKALASPEATAGSEVMCYYLQCLDTEAYAYAYEGSGRYNGALRTGELTDERTYWFYLRPGEAEGQYYIYNWHTGKAAGISGRYIYVNGSVDAEPFTISVSTEEYGYVISTAEGMWNVQTSENGYAQFTSKPAMWLLVPIGKFDTTGIVTPELPTNGIYYDLLGRPVENPTTGIYICNGRKVIVK